MKHVYFARPVGKAGPIKIGCSARLKARIAQISCDRKQKVRLITSAPGGFEEEGELHRRFADSRVDHEWFAVTDELMAVIDHVIDTGALPLAAGEDRNAVIARLYIGGATLESIGRQFSLTRERVRQILRKASVPSLGHRPEHRRAPLPITNQEREVARLYSEGTRPSLLRGMFPGVNIYLALSRTSTPRKGTGAWNRRADIDDLATRIAKLYRDGVTTREIAERVGLPGQCYVYRYLARVGMTPTRRHQTRLRGPSLSSAIAAFKNGATLSEIARQTGAVTQTVRRALVNAGVVITSEELERRRIAAVVAANHRRFAA